MHISLHLLGGGKFCSNNVVFLKKKINNILNTKNQPGVIHKNPQIKEDQTTTTTYDSWWSMQNIILTNVKVAENSKMHII